MNQSGQNKFNQEYPAAKIIHWWAIITVLATFLLLTLGAEVTTKKIGMADEVGFRSPIHLALVWLEGRLERESGGNVLGYIIEHSHRINGFTVGICTIILMAGLLIYAKKTWLKILGVIALLAVSAQGLLGGFRVELNILMGRNLALIHGCFAQLVFALLAAIAALTSPFWSTQWKNLDAKTAKRMRLLGITTLILIYCQLVLGGFVRHQDWFLGARLHLLGAFGVTLMLGFFLRNWFTSAETRTEFLFGVTLTFLLGCQLFLGVESWLSRFNPTNPMRIQQIEPIGIPPDLIRSVHYVVGSLIFANTLMIVLWTFRKVSSHEASKIPNINVENQTLEGAAV